jgi:anti-sigma factor RsiW
MTHLEAVEALASERYLLGEMSELERQVFEEHFFSCSECAEDVRVGSLLRDGAKAGLLSTRQARMVPWPRLGTEFVPWALAATLAGIAAYQSMWVLPELRREARPQVLAPIVLRPATRGADPVVDLQQGDAITLAVDVNAAEPVVELSYAVLDGAGVTVVAGRAPMPAAGTPLLLLVPSSAFAASGRHVLRLGDARVGGGSLGDYRFVVRSP